MSHLSSLLKRDLLQIFCVLNCAGISRTNTINICPDFNLLCINCKTDERSRIVRTASAEDCLLALEIGSDETLSDHSIHSLVSIIHSARNSCKNLIHNWLALEI